MKHLTTLLALLLSCSMLAQGPVEFPWNPDADGDDFIGVNDLMALLGEYSTSFSEENLYLSEDSLSATYYVDDWINYFECAQACRNLPGRWKLPSMNEIDFNIFDQNSHSPWIETSPENLWHTYDGEPRVLSLSTPFSSDALVRQDPLYASNVTHCYCVTKERPKVEYITCSSDDNNAFVNCCQERVSEGWWPLAGSNPASAGGDFRTWSQAFWRWAE